MSSSSDSSSYSSSDSEGAAVEEAQGVPNPPLGVQQDDGSDGDCIPSPALNVGPPSPGADSDMERPPKVPRCSLCYDFDQLLEQHVSSL